MKRHLFVGLVILAVAFVSSPRTASAEDYSHIRIVRLSFVEGTVEYQRPGQGWQDASLNLPIQEGFSLRTTDGYAEVEFESSMVIHLATNTSVEFTGLALRDGARITELSIPEGTAIVSAKLKHGDTLSVSASNLTVDLPRNARFRLDVAPPSSWVTVLHGSVEVKSQSGTASVSSGHTLRLGGTGLGSTEVAHAAGQDEFDKWVARRENAIGLAQNETSSILTTNSYTEGFADLYSYGIWNTIPGYGAAWSPYGVGSGWMPFMNGGWQYMGLTGWNWISLEPWGWMPYHFGSWINAPGIGWAWLPVGATAWTPATANWVYVNNQLGWVPTGPPQSASPGKVRGTAVPNTVTAILANQTAGGVIKAGNTVSLPTGAPLRAAVAPSPNFATTGTHEPANTAIQTAPAQIARTVASPASLHAPGTAAPQGRVAQLSSMPRSVLAPHSMPAPSVSHGGAIGGTSRAYSGGARTTGGSVGRMSVGAPPSATSSATTGGGSAHAGGTSGSSSGHH
jgi:FecR protein